MVFEVEDKVALVTGGVSGIGLSYAKELLRNGAKAVALADVDTTAAEKALREIQKEFGPNRALFVKTDVTDMAQFEDAFKQTVATFKHVDILINNAGMLNDKIWQKEISVNIVGAIHGILIGLENYLPKYKQGPEAVIVNLSSTAGFVSFPSTPVYAATKAATASLARSWGDNYHYNRTKVRVFAICPGATDTPLHLEKGGRNLGPAYEEYFREPLFASQTPDFVAQEGVKLIRTSPNGALWVIEGGEPAYQYIFPDRQTMPK